MRSEIAIASLLLDYINETSHTNNPGPSHYVKRAKDKNIAKLFIGVPLVRNGQCKQFQARLYPCQQPQKGYQNGLLFMLKGPRLKTASCRTLGSPEYGMANASNFIRGFTPASNPKRGNNI